MGLGERYAPRNLVPPTAVLRIAPGHVAYGRELLVGRTLALPLRPPAVVGSGAVQQQCQQRAERLLFPLADAQSAVRQRPKLVVVAELLVIRYAVPWLRRGEMRQTWRICG